MIRKGYRTVLPLCLCLYLGLIGRAQGLQVVHLVTDVMTAPADSSPMRFARVNGTIFFSATDGAHGRELWKTDGTEAGTVLVKDIKRGWGDSNPDALVASNGLVYFVADGGPGGLGIWRSDGSEAGTFMIAAMDPDGYNFLMDFLGAAYGGSAYGILADVSGTLFFANLNMDSFTFELWKTNGTVPGTSFVATLGSLYAFAFPGEFVAAGNKLFFTMGEHLWRSDGTEAGTVPLSTASQYMGLEAFTPLAARGKRLFLNSVN